VANQTSSEIGADQGRGIGKGFKAIGSKGIRVTFQGGSNETETTGRIDAMSGAATP